jgi:hypothetical protein
MAKHLRMAPENTQNPSVTGDENEHTENKMVKQPLDKIYHVKSDHRAF